MVPKRQNRTISDPYGLLFPRIWVPSSPPDQLCDACCHMTNTIKDIDKISFAYDIMSPPSDVSVAFY